MHPFVQAIIAVFVGLVVLGPAKVEQRPSALTESPAYGMLHDVVVAEPFPFELASIEQNRRGAMARLLAQDSPQRPDRRALQQLADADVIDVMPETQELSALKGIAGRESNKPFQGQIKLVRPIDRPAKAMVPLADVFDPDRVFALQSTFRVRVALRGFAFADFVPSVQKGPNPLAGIAPQSRLAQEGVAHTDQHLVPSGAMLKQMASTYENPNPYQLRIITGTNVNVRNVPRLGAEVQTQMSTGESLFITGKSDGNWFEVLLDSGIKGWVFGGYLGLPTAD